MRKAYSLLKLKGLRRSFRKGAAMLPEVARYPLLRHLFELPKDIPDELTISVAQTPGEMEQALRILHDSYVDAGYMSPDSYRLRILPQHSVVTTTLIVAKLGNEVIGTVSLILDNSLGLPMESSFDLSALRRDRRRLVEVSSLAIDRKYRTERGIFMLLAKYVMNYACDYSVADHMVIAVNPSMVDFYRAILLFDQLPLEVVENYGFVNGAPAVGQTVALLNYERHLEKIYAGTPVTRNILEFIRAKPKHLHFPERTFHHGIDSALTPEILRDFFCVRTNAFKNVNAGKKVDLVRYYAGSPFESEILKICENVRPARMRREFRFDTRCPVRVVGGLPMGAVDVLQVSRQGLYARFPSAAKEEAGKSITLEIEVGRGTIAKVQGETMWTKEGGLGLYLCDSDETWATYLSYLDDRIGNANNGRLTIASQKNPVSLRSFTERR